MPKIVDRAHSKVVITESNSGVEVVVCTRILKYFWLRDRSAGRILFRDMGECIMGLGDNYLRVAHKRGTMGRRERRKYARRLAQSLVTR